MYSGVTGGEMIGDRLRGTLLDGGEEPAVGVPPPSSHTNLLGDISPSSRERQASPIAAQALRRQSEIKASATVIFRGRSTKAGILDPVGEAQSLQKRDRIWCADGGGKVDVHAINQGGEYRERKFWSSAGYRSRHHVPSDFRTTLVLEALGIRVLRHERLQQNGDEGTVAQARFPVVAKDDRHRIDPGSRDGGCGGGGDEGLGHRKGRHPLCARFLSIDRVDGREARQLSVARQRRR